MDKAEPCGWCGRPLAEKNYERGGVIGDDSGTYHGYCYIERYERIGEGAPEGVDTVREWRDYLHDHPATHEGP